MTNEVGRSPSRFGVEILRRFDGGVLLARGDRGPANSDVSVASTEGQRNVQARETNAADLLRPSVCSTSCEVEGSALFPNSVVKTTHSSNVALHHAVAIDSELLDLLVRPRKRFGALEEVGDGQSRHSGREEHLPDHIEHFLKVLLGGQVGNAPDVTAGTGAGERSPAIGPTAKGKAH